MNKLDINEVTKYVEENIGLFHEKRIQSLEKLKLKNVLKRKNPYLFKTKNVQTSEQIVRGIVDAHLSSNEETLLGNWLEGLAIFINAKVYGGWKSMAEGIDLEFDKDNVRYAITIKSGPNWGNATQIRKMKDDFRKAERIIRTSNSQLHIVKVNGCCYGKNLTPDKGDYMKYCGQLFWQLISGEETLYMDIVEPLGYKARERNDEFLRSYAKQINKFTLQFTKEFCTPDGEIDWSKIVHLNSGKYQVKEKALLQSNKKFN